MPLWIIILAALLVVALIYLLLGYFTLRMRVGLQGQGLPVQVGTTVWHFWFWWVTIFWVLPAFLAYKQGAEVVQTQYSVF